jgi:signal transduction histidine kinase
MLAHELRSPLAPLVTSLDLLAMETEPEQQQFALETMRNQTTHMVRLIDDLLDVSRMIRNKIQIKKELMTLAEVVAHAVEVTKPLFDSQRQEVTVLIPTQPIYLEADLTRLAQVIGNLLNNSSKYTDYGGRIWLIGEQTANEVMIKVKDTGIGISPDILPYIFDLFTQADQSLDRSKGGLGIGLSLVKNLVEMHDGRVEAKSAGLGKGSEFIVYLPAVSPVDFKKAASADESAKAEIVTGLKVLVVDDNTYAARGMALIIEKLGCKVQIAHDGLSACAAADNFKPDVIFLDIGLPGRVST